MSSNNSSDTFQTVLGFLLGIYAVVSQVMAIVFWVEYVKTDSLFMAIVIDPFLAEIKGLLWPFFI